MISSENRIGKFRTNTDHDWGEAYANKKLAIEGFFEPTKEKNHDGFVFTTRNWVPEGNYRNKKYQSRGNGEVINIDDIIGAFNAASLSGNLSKMSSISEAISFLNGLAQEVYDKTPSPENKESQRPKLKCPVCKTPADSSHIDKVGGPGTYERELEIQGKK